MTLTMVQLEELFYAEGGLEKVLSALKWELDRSDYFDGLMISRVTDNAEEAKGACNELTGLYGILVKAYHFSEAALDVKEPQAAYKLRVDDNKSEGKKKTDGAINAEAANVVSQYRRVRSYLNGYVTGLEKSISTLQSILKYEGSPKGGPRPTTQQ